MYFICGVIVLYVNPKNKTRNRIKRKTKIKKKKIDKIREKEKKTKQMQEKIEIVIPPHISQQAFFTIPLFGIASIITFLYDFQRLSVCSFGIMLTSFAHWNLVKKEGIERNADRLMIVLTYTSLWIDAQRFCPEYLVWWYPITLFSTVVITTNQLIFYHIYKSTRDQILLEKANYISTYIHLLFSHVVPPLSCIYGVVTSRNC